MSKWKNHISLNKYLLLHFNFCQVSPFWLMLNTISHAQVQASQLPVITLPCFRGKRTEFPFEHLQPK